MLRHLIIASLRAMRKNISSSLINFFGLTLSLIFAAIIGLHIDKELTFDAYHEKANRIYRVMHNEKAGEIPGDRHLPTVGPPVGPALKQSFSAVEDAVRFRYSPDRIMRVGTNQFYEGGVYYVDPSVFNIFSFPLKKGNEATALTEPNNVVLSSEMALKYFGHDDPLGKSISLDNSIDLKVTGVLQPIPVNSHLRFDFLLPFDAFRVPYGYPVDLNTWGWISFHTYVLLKPDATAKDVESQLPDFVKAHWPEDRAKKFKMQLQPLSAIYLGEVKHEQIAAGNTTYLFISGMAGLFILLIAGFNFANLFTSIHLTRAKEMGVRKVAGASKRLISKYIVAEAIVVAVVAWATAVLLLPGITQYLKGYGFEIPAHTQTPALLIVLLVAIGIAAVSAIYPSLLLASSHYQKLLKGAFRTSRGGAMVRMSMLLVQFCVTVVLVSSVLVIDKQMKFMQTKDLGYAKDELLLLRMPGEGMADRFTSIKTKLLQHRQVRNVTLGGGRMDGSNGNVPIYVEGNLEEGIPMSIDAASFNYFETIGVKMVAGREITDQQPADTLRGVMINETAAKTFGWTPEQALGKKIQVGEIVLDGEVIGVFPDFNFGLLHSEIGPLIMNYPRVYLQDIYVRFNPDENLNELVEKIRDDWNEIAPEYPFDYLFLNDHLQNKYTSEKFLAFLFKLFALGAIVISGLGLFGLVSQDVAFRVKEMGVRKVLGAGSIDLAIHITKPFVLLILLAMVISWPLSFMGMNMWLAEFSYRTAMPVYIFVVAGLITLTTAMLTILYKVVVVSKANPIKSLRTD